MHEQIEDKSATKSPEKDQEEPEEDKITIKSNLPTAFKPIGRWDK